MTREEQTISNLKKLKSFHNGSYGADIDRAIKALEQEPMENFESVKDHILKLASDYKCWDNRLTHDEALELCHILEQEPKTGHWVEGLSGDLNIHNILCSRCNEGYPSKGHANSQYTREKFKWCPKCGAKMIEPQESEA